MDPPVYPLFSGQEIIFAFLVKKSLLIRGVPLIFPCKQNLTNTIPPHTTMRAIKKYIGSGTINHVDFNLKDDKGRAIGLSVGIFFVTVTEAAETDRNCWLNFDAPGDYVGVTMQATRNGKDYGSSQCPEYYKTQEEADAQIAKRTKSTRARYAKKFAQA